MLAVIPFCSRDIHLAVQLLDFVDELGGTRKHPCLLVADNKLTDEEIAPVKKAAKLAFKSIGMIRTPYSLKLSKTGDSPWPVGPNWAFYTTAMYIGMTTIQPFLWLEPDCCPLVPDWLDQIEKEYMHQGKPFLGPVIETQNRSFPVQYMNGTAVYPANAIRYFHGPFVDFLKGTGNAFDVACSKATVPNCHFSALIQHGYCDSKGINHWGTHPNTPLVFKEAREEGDGDNVITPKSIHDGAVLFHPCKNSSLIDLLRKRREQGKVAA